MELLESTIYAGDLVLKRWEPEWAEEAAAAVRESVAELKPFLPWARDDYDADTARAFIEMSVDNWTEGTEFNYAVFNTGGVLVGAARRLHC